MRFFVNTLRDKYLSFESKHIDNLKSIGFEFIPCGWGASPMSGERLHMEPAYVTVDIADLNALIAFSDKFGGVRIEGNTLVIVDGHE